MNPTVADALKRHSARRKSGVPTVSVLVGNPSAAVAAWRSWATANGLRPVLVAVSDPAQVPDALLRELAAGVDLRAAADAHLRRAAGLPPSPNGVVRVGTRRDVDQLIAAAGGAADAHGAARLAAHLACSDPPSGADRPPSVERLDGILGSGAAGFPRWRVIRALDGLLADGERPAVLLLEPLPAAAVTRWPAAVSPAAQLAEAVPSWAVALCCTAAAFETFRVTATRSRATSLILGGEVPLPVPDPAVLGERLAGVLPDRGEREEAVKVLAGAGAPEPLTSAFVAAARARPRRDDAARSAAERLLFELLEVHPRTVGRFVLNGSPGFLFGPRPAEVDLLAAGLRLAVEVDGYHHFTDADVFRRDRRKDWELQRHGFVVVRVLADDVVARTEGVLDTILVAVDHCHQHTDRGGI